MEVFQIGKYINGVLSVALANGVYLCSCISIYALYGKVTRYKTRLLSAAVCANVL
jgi:hypothetical protein